MRIPDNLDIYEMHEREQERRSKRHKDIEELPFEDKKIEVAFYINEREEDIEILEKFLKRYKFNYEKEMV